MAEKVEIVVEAIDDASKTIENVNGELDTLAGAARMEAFAALGDAGQQAFEIMTSAAMDFVNVAGEAELIMTRLQFRLSKSDFSMTADQMDQIAGSLSEMSGFDDEAILSGMSSLLQFGNLSEEQFNRATKAAVDLAAVTGMDLNSAFMMVGRTLDNPEAGFGRLSRQIGDMSESEKAAIAQAIEMGDTVKAQNILLDAYQAKVGGAAEVVGTTYVMEIEKAKNMTDNWKQAIGEGLIPALGAQNTQVVAAGMMISEYGRKAIDLGAALGTIAMALKTLGVGGGALASIGATLSGALAAATPAIIAAGVAILAALQAVFVTGIARLGAAVGRALGDALGIVLPPELEKLQDLMIEKGPFSAETWKAAQVVALRGALDIIAAITNLASRFANVGAAIVRGIWSGMQNQWEWLKAQISNNMTSLLQWVKDQLGIASPSKVWADAVGKPIAQGIGAGFTQTIGAGQSSFSAPLMPSGAGAGGVTVVYSPVFSTASRSEIERELVPYVKAAMRRA